MRDRVPARRRKELREAFANAGIATGVMSVTGGSHIRVPVSVGAISASYNASMTPGDRRDLMNAVRDAKRTLRAKGAEI